MSAPRLTAPATRPTRAPAPVRACRSGRRALKVGGMRGAPAACAGGGRPAPVDRPAPTLTHRFRQLVARDYPRPNIDTSAPFQEAAALSASLASFPRPAKPLKVVIAGAGKLRRGWRAQCGRMGGGGWPPPSPTPRPPLSSLQAWPACPPPSTWPTPATSPSSWKRATCWAARSPRGATPTATRTKRASTFSSAPTPTSKTCSKSSASRTACSGRNTR